MSLLLKAFEKKNFNIRFLDMLSIKYLNPFNEKYLDVVIIKTVYESIRPSELSFEA